MNHTHDGFRLYARPSFCEGIARLLDFAGLLNEYNNTEFSEHSDARALRSDWEAVGLDIQTAIERFDQEHHD